MPSCSDLGDWNATVFFLLITNIQVQETARDSGVVIDSRLTLFDHVASLCQSGYYQLRQLRPAIRCSSDDAKKTLVQAFIANHLDYCNALFYGITDELFRHLQSVQNAAARLVTDTRRSDHISPVLRQLHWLSVRQRVVFKVATLVKKRKVKEADLYSAFIEVPYTPGAQVRITQCYLQTTPYLPLPRKHSPDGASQTEVADI